MHEKLQMENVTFRHLHPSPNILTPWKKRLGPGIHHISLDLSPGEIVGLIGPNGSGKTTLIRVIAGLYQEMEGNINLNLIKRRERIGFMPEQVRWEGKKTVFGQLKEISHMQNKNNTDLNKLITLVGLNSQSNTMLKNLSQGMRQRLSLACALVGSPDYLVLDEPMNGLDPLAQKAFVNLISQLAKNGMGILISSHRVQELKHFCDKMALMHQGQMLAFDALEVISENLGIEVKTVIEGDGEPPENTTSYLDGWRGETEISPEEIIERYAQKGLKFMYPSPLDIADLIKAATGLGSEEGPMDITLQSMIPRREIGEDE